MYKVLIKYAYLYILYPKRLPYRFFLKPDSQEEDDGVVVSDIAMHPGSQEVLYYPSISRPKKKADVSPFSFR